MERRCYECDQEEEIAALRTELDAMQYQAIERTSELIALREQLEANMKLMRKAKTVLGHSACFTPEWLTPEVKGLLTTIDASIENEGK